MTSLQVIFFTYLLVVCSSFQSLHFASAVPYNRSLAAVQNMLSYYGVNASNFANGQLLCPPCSSSDSCNKSDIHIGVLGSIIDPFMAVLTPEERTFLETQTEGECMVGTPVYYPPAAEYLLALLLQFEELNNQTDVLPHHRLCLLSSTNISSAAEIDGIFHAFLDNPKTPAIFDLSPSETSIFLQHLVLPHKLSLLRHSHYSGLIPVNGHRLWTAISRRIRNSPPSQQIVDVEIAQDQFADYFFTADPLGVEVHYSILTLAEFYGWRQIAYVLADEWSITRLSPSFARTYVGRRITTCFFSYTQRDGTLLSLFRQLSQYELQVIIFHGSVQLYFNTLLEASKYRFVGPNYAWIFPYFGAIFPDNYQDSNLWCNYTNEQIHTIKNALKGSISIGVSEGFFERFNSFNDRFVDFAGKVTGYRDIYKQNHRFQQTSLIYDMAGIIGKSIHSLVVEKAERLNISQSMVDISYSEDRRNLSDSLRRVTLDRTAVAGNLSFTVEGDRETAYIVVRNFVPIQNNFSVNTSRELDPWDVQVRACMQSQPALRMDYEITFFDENGTTMAEGQSSVLFASGTTAPPPDRPVRLFRRSNTASVASTTLSTLLFFLAVSVYVAYVFYQDKKREMYNNSWMFSENDLHYISADRQQGIWGRLNNISMVMGVRHYGNSEEAAKLNDGNFAALVRMPFPKDSISRRINQECNMMRELKHKNICPFYGCLFAGVKSALLYKYFSRGTLEHLLLNSEIDFQCVFRMSFALDVARGMEYLHSKRIIHGRLETRACVVDENWVVKLRDYGLKVLHGEDSDLAEQNRPRPSSRLGNKRSTARLAPEIRFLGTGISLPGDVFSFGNLLEELMGTKYASKCNRATCRVAHEKEVMSPKLLGVMDDCRENNPNHRPTFDTITAQLTQIYQLEHNVTEQGVMHIYSRQLEERLEELTNKVTNQQNKQNEIMRHYIPKTMVSAINEKEEVPIEEYKDVVIVCIELTCMDLLSAKLDSEALEYLVLTMQKAIEGVTTTFDVAKLQSSGNIWILAAGIKSEKCSADKLLDAVNAAFAVVDMFSGIFLPGLPYVHPTIRVGMHRGSVLCGVIDEPVPQLVAIGKSITTVIAIATKAKDGRILSSHMIGEELMNCIEFKVTFNAELTVFGESVHTTWLDLSSLEMLHRQQKSEIDLRTIDRNVTIKQCIVRKPTVTASEDKKPSALLPLQMDSTTSLKRFGSNRCGVDYTLPQLPPEADPVTRPKSASTCSAISQSSVFLNIDSGRSSLSSSIKDESDVFPPSREGEWSEKSRSMSLAGVASNLSPQPRPWSACSEPARLIDLEGGVVEEANKLV